MTAKHVACTASVAVLLVSIGCSRPEAVVAGDDAPSLMEAFSESFLIGAALNPEQFNERDARGVKLVTKHFNSITPENVMKWEVIHPEPGRYDFDEADRFVAFGEANDMMIVGHTLVWHSQTPQWVFEDAAGNPLGRDSLLARMRNHIHTVVGRYKGRVHGWDVVNEALNEDGTLRQSPWMKIIGDDYIERAFQFAHEADPAAQLYYNDYSLENAAKRNGATGLLSRLLEKGVTVTGIGTQAHSGLDWPSIAQFDSTIAAFADTGVDVMVTELDIDLLPFPSDEQTADISLRGEISPDMNPYPDMLPDSMQLVLAERYAAVFRVFLKHRESISRVTFWGVTDGDTWKNNWPINGRTAYPLLFDRNYQGKPALDAVIGTLQ
ncbi:MAG: endo-1,4-beta-xylanase [Rhodothermales bacterium]|nr:endo-1,4-beta-xylanase [Rhodothermales bacterium]